MSVNKATVEVALPLPVKHTFSYLLPSNVDEICQGVLVEVPFGKKQLSGVVWGEPLLVQKSVPSEKLKPITHILDANPVLPQDIMKLLGWMARYYFAPPGELVSAALPPGIVRLAEEVYFVAQGRRTATLFDDEVSAALKILEAKGEATAHELVASGVSAQLLAAMLKQGVVQKKWRLRKPKVQAHYERIAVLTNSDAAKRVLKRSRSRQAQAVIETILQRKEVLVKELTKIYANANAVIKRLAYEQAIIVKKRRTFRVPIAMAFKGELRQISEQQLTQEQKLAITTISDAIKQNKFAPFLLFGPTGSGKTEVYLRAAANARKIGKTTLVLVPEIALTPQLVARFTAEFGNRIAVLHSALSDGERLDEWSRVRSGLVDVVIGARSALFAPLPNLGLIIVDEEQEQAFRSEERALFNARDAAVKRAEINNATVVLGSATPSLESWLNAHRGKYRLLRLSRRVSGGTLPEVNIVPLTPRDLKDGMLATSEFVVEANAAIARNEQVMVFVPRRGFAPLLECPKCGWTLTCPNCDVSLTFHRETSQFVCHYCEYTTAPPDVCDNCGYADLLLVGAGTEKITALLENYFLSAKILRLDKEVMRRKGALEQVLSDFAQGKADILVGTHIIAKGHHFPRVSLVCVLLADHSINFPDLRATERAFQLFMQISGRSGRERKGKVIVQTLNPKHKIFEFLKNHDYERFAEYELVWRKKRGYPPFWRITRILLLSENQSNAAEAANTVKQWATNLVQHNEVFRQMRIQGPAPAPLSRLRNKYRFHILFKFPNSRVQTAFTREFARSNLEETLSRHSVSVRFETDALDLL